jgi:hypothetical protein
MALHEAWSWYGIGLLLAAVIVLNVERRRGIRPGLALYALLIAAVVAAAISLATSLHYLQ